MAKTGHSGPIEGWIRKKVILHSRTGKPMVRKDGKDFVFPIRRKKPR